jgi:hypothetical protein
MTEKPWAEIDEDWKRKEQQALAQREMNSAAAREGRASPFPNPFRALGPAKAPSDSSAEEYHRWFLEHRKMCRQFEPKRHTI